MNAMTGSDGTQRFGVFLNIRKCVDAAKFVASPITAIKEGVSVMHLKFGRGTVVSIDQRKVATIRFDQISDNPEKRIMLQYAKLQVLEKE